MSAVYPEKWIQYSDDYCVRTSSVYLGKIVERAIALYCDCPWYQVFPEVRYPRFLHSCNGDVVAQEFYEIAKACGIDSFINDEFLMDAVMLTLRGCVMLRDDWPVVHCCYKLEGTISGAIYGEIDLVTGSPNNYGFWEVKTGMHPNPGISQIEKAWITAVCGGAVGRDTISKIGVLDTRGNRKWVRYLAELSEEEKDWLLRC